MWIAFATSSGGDRTGGCSTSPRRFTAHRAGAVERDGKQSSLSHPPCRRSLHTLPTRLVGSHRVSPPLHTSSHLFTPLHVSPRLHMRAFTPTTSNSPLHARRPPGPTRHTHQLVGRRSSSNVVDPSTEAHRSFSNRASPVRPAGGVHPATIPPRLASVLHPCGDPLHCNGHGIGENGAVTRSAGS